MARVNECRPLEGLDRLVVLGTIQECEPCGDYFGEPVSHVGEA
jgi:hypothetical protein